MLVKDFQQNYRPSRGTRTNLSLPIGDKAHGVELFEQVEYSLGVLRSFDSSCECLLYKLVVEVRHLHNTKTDKAARLSATQVQLLEVGEQGQLNRLPVDYFSQSNGGIRAGMLAGKKQPVRKVTLWRLSCTR